MFNCKVVLHAASLLLIDSTRCFIIFATGFHSAGVRYGVNFQQHSGCLEINRGKLKARLESEFFSSQV